MADEFLEVGIGLDDAVTSGIRAITRTIGGLRRRLSALFRGIGRTIRRVVRNVLSLKGAIVGLAAGVAVRGILQVNKTFDRLAASLETVTGSSEAAKKALDTIVKFATSTPFQVDKITEAFTRLKFGGIEPTNELLTAFGDIAAAAGRDILTLAEAVVGLTTGEAERMKQFGIIARVAGDKLRVTFQGQTEEILRTKDAIVAYVKELGETRFQGGMIRQMRTLGGAFSNFGDALDQFIRRIGTSGFNKSVVRLTRTVTALLGSAEGSRAASAIGASLGRFTDQLTDFIEGLDFEKIGDTFGAITEALRDVAKISADVAGRLAEAINVLSGKGSGPDVPPIGGRPSGAGIPSVITQGPHGSVPTFENTGIKGDIFDFFRPLFGPSRTTPGAQFGDPFRVDERVEQALTDQAIRRRAQTDRVVDSVFGAPFRVADQLKLPDREQLISAMVIMEQLLVTFNELFENLVKKAPGKSAAEKEAERQARLSSSSAGIQRAIDRIKELSSRFSIMENITLSLADTMRDSLAGGMDLVIQKLAQGRASFRDFAISIGQSLARIGTNAIAEQITGSFFGAFSAAHGATVTAPASGAFVPMRLHSKERVTIEPLREQGREKSERRSGGDVFHIQINATDARSFKTMLAEEKELITSLAAQTARRNPSLTRGAGF